MSDDDEKFDLTKAMAEAGFANEDEWPREAALRWLKKFERGLRSDARDVKENADEWSGDPDELCCGLMNTLGFTSVDVVWALRRIRGATK